MASPIIFVRSVVEETKKVVWPNRETVIRHTVLVVLTVAVAVLIFAGVDFLLQKLVIFALQ